MTQLLNLYIKLKEKLSFNYPSFDLNQNHNLKDCDWYNHIFTSPSIRYGHLEYFKGSNDKIEVVHCVLFPSYYKPLPIFGFDAISLGGRITGIFCDYTHAPFSHTDLIDTIHNAKESLLHLQRELPEWTEFFSENFIAIDPKDSYDQAEATCLELLEKYVNICNEHDFNNIMLTGDQTKNHIKEQDYYSICQRKNTKTQKALAKYIGEEEAKRFIDSILFPISYNTRS
jgi:phycocyanobilin:ferredoxin oxidoreductase